MRRYIVLLLITGTLWAQTELDKLVLKDGTEYQGKYLRTEKSFVYFNQFKSKNEWLARSISLQDVQTIQLKDGGNLELTLEKIDVYEAKKNKYEKGDKYFVGLLTCSVIVVAMIYIINPLEGLGQSPGPIFTPPDA